MPAAFMSELPERRTDQPTERSTAMQTDSVRRIPCRRHSRTPQRAPRAITSANTHFTRCTLTLGADYRSAEGRVKDNNRVRR